MGLHPVLMTAAFVILNPLTVISFRLLRDVWGYSHKTAKLVHASFQTTGLILGILAVRTMWMHMDTWDEDHLSSIHALLGIMMMTLWALQVVMSLVIFFFMPGWVRA